MLRKNILDCIGNTPMVKLNKVVPQDAANIYVKLEYFNPSGSKKDRMALAMIEGAEKRGTLKKGMRVVEYSGGSTGAALALICSLKGYPFRLITSNAFSKEKINMMRALGAQLEIIESPDGKISKSVIDAMVSRATEIAKEPNTFFTNQLSNNDVLDGFEQLGKEIIDQLKGIKVDAICDSVGTAGTLMGISRAFKGSDRPQFIALEPSSLPVLTSGEKGSQSVEGIGLGFIPALLDMKHYDKAMAIDEKEARVMAKRLAKEEGIFAGTSTGINVAGAIEIAKTLGPNKNIVVVACDAGLKYLNEGLYFIKANTILHDWILIRSKPNQINPF